MIASLRGRLAEKAPNRIIVDIGGVGYDVAVPLSTYYTLGNPGTDVALRVHTHVREDILALYGFSTALELQIFERLIGISGIGPKLALAVLSGIDVTDLVRAIQAGDVGRLTAIPGIGKKTAERIGLELKDKLPKGLVDEAGAGSGGWRARRRTAPGPALGPPEPGISSAPRREGGRGRAGQDRVAGLRNRPEAGAARAGARVA